MPNTPEANTTNCRAYDESMYGREEPTKCDSDAQKAQKIREEFYPENVTVDETKWNEEPEDPITDIKQELKKIKKNVGYDPNIDIDGREEPTKRGRDAQVITWKYCEQCEDMTLHSFKGKTVACLKCGKEKE